jgi:diguanylate cyclase (GGDEF)-like protein/PAS domain S-box-containing protein
MPVNDRIHILLVEDNSADADYLTELLQQEEEPSFSIQPVPRLADALAVLSESSFDAVLLDLGLPDSQGLDTLTAIRRRSAAPIIVLTGLADEEFALRAIKSGADDYLIKGQINPVLVVRTIRYTIERRHINEVLRENSHRLQLAIQSGRMVAWSWDAKTGRITTSENFKEILGRDPVTDAGEGLAMVHPDDRELLRGSVRKTLRESGFLREEFRVIRPDNGEIIWIEDRARLYRDEAGAVVRLSGIATDITERERTEERIAHLASFPESTPNPIIETDLDGMITYVNPAARQLFPDITAKGLNHPLIAGWKDITEEMKRTGNMTFSREMHAGNFAFQQLFFYAPGMKYFRINHFDITQRKQAEQALRESEERYRITTEAALDAIFTIDEKSTILVVNPAVERIFGYGAEELTGKSLLVLMPERFREMHRNAVKKVIATGRRNLPLGPVELPGLHKNGREVPLEITYGEFRKEGHHYFIGIVRDVSERKRVEETLRRRDAMLRQAGQMANLGAWEIEITAPGDLKANQLRWSDQVYRIFGYQPGEVEVSIPFFLKHVHPEDLPKVMEQVEKTATLKRSCSIDHRIIRADGAERILSEQAETTIDGDRITRIVGAVQDITERIRAEETIKYQTYHDLLTGLPNRAQLMVRLQVELVQHEKNQKKLAVMHIDLDRFRAINDTLGHSAGDRVIRAVTERLSGLTRKNDTLARIGSDEFIILFADLLRVEEAALFARRIVETMRTPLTLDKRELYTTVSVGMSIYPEDGKDAEVLLKNADIAVSTVKEWGRNNFQFFNSALNRRTVERLLLESNLRQSLDRGELQVYYQPQISLKTGKMIAVEALSRWMHPDLGLLEPAQFIPVAEEIGFIGAIDEWVLKTAATQNRIWMDAGFPPLCMTVNLSAHRFQQPDLVEAVKRILQESGLEPKHIDIEITESTAMRDIERSVPNLAGLQELGIDLSIDDFGTGYSSLNYLKRFPVHKLKIDKTFIHGLSEDRNDQAIVKAVIAMGHNLGLTVIAEGVETKDQLTFLKDSDCDEVQGFLFSEPVPAEKLRRLLSA